MARETLRGITCLSLCGDGVPLCRQLPPYHVSDYGKEVPRDCRLDAAGGDTATGEGPVPVGGAS